MMVPTTDGHEEYLAADTKLRARGDDSRNLAQARGKRSFPEARRERCTRGQRIDEYFPCFDRAYHALAVTMMKAGRPEDARETYEQILTRFPDDLEVHFSLGGLYYGGRLADPAASLRHYRHFLSELEKQLSDEFDLELQNEDFKGYEYETDQSTEVINIAQDKISRGLLKDGINFVNIFKSTHKRRSL